MEWFWYVVASLGAGVGTGRVGLSAATVMVPMLIVLCPSFAGETGVYQATAVALASDILGSAVTTYTYAKHKNIDLKRGWLIMLCILIMSAIGSYAAFVTGNVVLGGFTLNGETKQVSAIMVTYTVLCDEDGDAIGDYVGGAWNEYIVDTAKEYGFEGMISTDAISENTAYNKDISDIKQTIYEMFVKGKIDVF